MCKIILEVKYFIKSVIYQMLKLQSFFRRDQTRTQSLFKCFFGMREDWGLGNEERAGSHGKGRIPSHETSRAPQPNPQSSLIPKNT